MKILVPLDGTVLAEQALPTAVSLARRMHAKIDLVLVNEARPGEGLERWPWAVSSAETHGDYLAEKAAHLGRTTGLLVEHGVAAGKSAEEICHYADEREVDLIVMASRCPTGLARVLGGSVADGVIRHTRKPVLLLPSGLPGRRVRQATLRPERVLVALDGSDTASAALNAAMALADRGVTELHLVEVVQRVKRASYKATPRGRIDRDATSAVAARVNADLEALAADVADRTGCDVFPHAHIDDDVAHGILNVARGFNVSMIALGTHGRGASRLLVGSVVERVLRNGRYPMLLAHSPSASTESIIPQSKEAPCAQARR